MLIICIAVLLLEKQCQAYRIIEWSPIDDDGSASGSGEDTIKSKSNFFIWNGIESKSTKSPTSITDDGLSALRRLNPGMSIFLAKQTTQKPRANHSKQKLRVGSMFDENVNLYHYHK